MQHITNVLVHSNRCEVVDGHIFATGDKGLPHIHLQFLYMFGETSLQGKNLECKYLLPNRQYSAETVRITGKDEVTFPIHYSCFTVNGWTTLRITLVSGSNRVTLEDITIKTKETKLGQAFSNAQVEQAITQAIEITTTSIRAEGDSIKQELREYIQQEKENLKGEKGEKGATGERGPVGEQGPRGYTGEKGSQGQRGEPGPQGQQGLRGEQGVQGNPGKNLEFTWKDTQLGVRKEGDWSYSYKDLKGPKGDKGEPGTRGPQGERGVGVTSVTPLNNNQVRLEYGDGQSAVVEIPTVAGQQGQKGEKGEDGKGLEFKWRGTELGVRQAGTSDYIYQNLQGVRGERGIQGERGERGISGLTGADGVGIRNITSNQEEDTVTLQFSLTNNTNKNVSFTVPQSSVEEGTASPLKVEFEEIFSGNSRDLIFGKPLGNYQFLQIQNTQQTATIPAKVGAKFNFWYTNGEVLADRIHMGSSSTYKVYGIKLRGQVSGGVEVDLSNYYDKTQSDERYAQNNYFHDELLSQTQADRLYIPQSLGVSFAKLNTSVNFQNITASGDILAQGTVGGLSDVRLKTDVKKIENSLEILKKISGYTFTMGGQRHLGVIAQEVQKVLPEVIRETENGYLSVAYGNMIGLLIETNKELLRRIEVLEHGIKQ